MSENIKFTLVEEFTKDGIIENTFINDREIDRKTYEAIKDDRFEKMYGNIKLLKQNKDIIIKQSQFDKNNNTATEIVMEDIYTEEIISFIDVLDELSREDKVILMLDFIDKLREDQHRISTVKALKDIKADINTNLSNHIKRINNGRLI